MAFFLYRSSAGSGKTYTLVKEYLKIVLKNPQRFKNILAITFTNKAAGEMKERIILALKQLAQGQAPELAASLKKELPPGLDLAEQASQVLTMLLHRYSDFSVSTIDSFMFRIVNSFALELDLPLNFRVDLNHQQICSYVVDHLLAQVGVNRELTEIILCFVFSRTGQDRSWYIEDDIRKFEEQLFNEKNLDWIEMVGQVELGQYHLLIDQLNRIVLQFVAQLQKLGHTGIGMIEGAGLEVKKYSPADFLKKIATIEAKEIGSLELYKSFAQNRWYAASAPAELKVNFDTLLSSGLADVHQQVLTLFASQQSTACTAFAILVNIYLLAIVNQIKKLVDDYKDEFSVVPISEFNRRVNRVVRESPVPFIYAIIGDKFYHYLIDEFQDTNTLQWQNFLPLIEDSLAYNAFNMAVGDGKQSIYRWRGSDVEILEQDILNRFKGPQIKLKRLTRNYRSRDNIVEFNNRFFSAVVAEMKEQYPLIGSIYDEVMQNSSGRAGGRVTLDVFSESQQAEQQILNRVGEVIPLLVSQGYQYRDVCILVREKKSGGLVADYLLNQKIPIISTDSLKLASSPLIQFIIEAIKVLLNPENKIAGAAMTFFPFVYGMQGVDTLTWCEAHVAGRGRKLSWPPLAEFVRRKTHLIRLPVYELVEELIRIFSLSDMKKDHSIILGFLDIVAQYVQENNDDMASFLEWWEFNSEEFSLAIPEEKDAVKILTIHKAKGLEFPVVIIPFSDWSIRMDKKLWLPLAEAITDNPLNRLPLLVNSGKKLNKTGFQQASAAEEEMVRVDNLNLLYVAMTRAIDELYLMSHRPDLNLLHSHAVTWMQQDEAGERYIYGEVIDQVQPRAEAIVPYREVDQLISKSWHHRLTIRHRAEEFWRFDPSYRLERAKWGIIVHQILAEVEHLDDVGQVVEKYIEAGDISVDERAQIEQILSGMFAMEQVQAWFDPHNNRIFAEVSILTGKEELRPDRVIVAENEVTIVDFKTGKEKAGDVDQIEKYKQVVAEMGYSSIKAYLFYIEDMKVKSV